MIYQYKALNLDSISSRLKVILKVASSHNCWNYYFFKNLRKMENPVLSSPRLEKYTFPKISPLKENWVQKEGTSWLLYSFLILYMQHI